MINENKQTVVYYHKGCNDGTGAAVSLFSKVPKGSTFIPIQYGDEININVDYADIIFADYCPTIEDIESILSKLNEESRLIILDHHISAINKFKEYYKNNKIDDRLLFYFDNGMCGSLIAYHLRDLYNVERGTSVTETDDIFTNLTSESIVREEFFLGGAKQRFYELLDIRDRWVDKDEDEKLEADYLSSFLQLTDWTNKDIEDLYELVEGMDFDGLSDMLDYGEIAYRVNHNQAKSIVAKASKYSVVNKETSKTVEVAISFTNVNISDAGSLWAKEVLERGEENHSLFVGVIIIPEDELVVFSVRSNEHTSAKVFCESFGGGGHVQASGARVPDLYKKTPEEIIKAVIQSVEKEKVIL